MPNFVFGMNLSLDGYTDHMKLSTSPILFRHFIEKVRGLSCSLYGRKMYETMRYWDEDSPDWDADRREFAEVWRNQHKWVVSRSLTSVGPNATLVKDLQEVIPKLQTEVTGEIDVAGPELAQSMTDLGLIDEYRLYLHPNVLGQGNPFFQGARPPLKLVESKVIDDIVIRLTYVPV